MQTFRIYFKDFTNFHDDEKQFKNWTKKSPNHLESTNST